MKTAIAAGVAGVALVGAGLVTANALEIEPFSATATTTVEAGSMGCNDWPVQLTTGECQAAGTIRFVSLQNLQGALQFCKWRGANPGEWTRLKGYASSGTRATNIVTWFGGHILNDLEAYFVAGGPNFTILPNNAPNVCKTPIAPPVIAGTTPGETDVTVTVED